MKGILKSGDSTARIKKSVRFNEDISSQECQLYPAEIEVILSRIYKNFKRAEKRRKAADSNSQTRAAMIFVCLEKGPIFIFWTAYPVPAQTSASAGESKDCYQVKFIYSEKATKFCEIFISQ